MHITCNFSLSLRLSVMLLLTLLQAPSIAQAQTSVEWHRVTNGQPVLFTLSPANPTTTNAISFVGPADGRSYLNYCVASVELGAPVLTIDPTNRTITVFFSPVTNIVCPDLAMPVSGIEGKLGLLSAGTWAFNILTNTYTFSVAQAPAQTSVEWHRITNGLPVALALSPTNPTTTNVVSFIAPTDDLSYVNSCYASVELGDPILTIDPTNLTITVFFSPVTNIACPNIALPVSGVDGKLGFLRSGTWVFSILTNTYTFSVVEAPLGLSIQTLGAPSSFQFEWPVSADSFGLEFTDNLVSGVWNELTNAPTIVNNQNVLQIQSDSTNRFFRLRRLN